MAARRHPDDWMHLPPEVEALVPALIARLSGGERDAVTEAARLEHLILTGDRESWLAYIDAAAPLAEAKPHDPRDEPDRVLLAAILADQYELIQAVLDLDSEADRRRVRLRELSRG